MEMLRSEKRVDKPSGHGMVDDGSAGQTAAERFDVFGGVPDDALITEATLCQLFQRSSRTISRAIQKGMLPKPLYMFRERTWTAGAIRQHIRQLEAAQNGGR